MRIEKSQHVLDNVLVHVEPNELQCDVRLLPYGTCVGTINVKSGRINVWTPAASKPRGYRKAAERLLREVREKHFPVDSEKVSDPVGPPKPGTCTCQVCNKMRASSKLL